MQVDTGTDWMAPSVRLWRMRRAQIIAVGLVAALAAGVGAGVAGGAGLGVVSGVAVLVIAAVSGVFLHRKFRSWAYREREEDLLVSRGVLIRRVSVVPYGRMQFVEVTAGPMERWFKLATVQLHTAAAASNARIPGLERGEAARLRDRLAMLGEAKAAGL
ncbi:MAG: PH domain-containing protein [Streptosporangiaceae bacterium]|nr:PH domain-containing protein [Streptosporangiaceae bacterium]